MTDSVAADPAASLDGLAAGVRVALADVREQFPGAEMKVEPDGSGGAFVVVDPVELGPSYSPPRTWLGFQLNVALPDSDVYPHYIGVVARTDGADHGEGIQPVQWQGRDALQLSRRSNRWNPAHDNAANKAEKVIAWLRSS